jgi:alpha-methylacyl-CoA racemase
MTEAPEHPHNRERASFVRQNGQVQPAPAPRFSATPGEIQGPPPHIGQFGKEALREWGIDQARLSALANSGLLVAHAQDWSPDAP